MPRLRFLLAAALSIASLSPAAVAAKPSKRPAEPAEEPAEEVGSAWYAAVDGKTEGPFDDAGFVVAYLSGRVTDDTLVWWDGAAQWVPLAKASWFVELDRWYVRHGSKGFGPVTGAALRDKLAKGRAEGHDIAKLEVRLEWSGWVPLASAAPLRDRDMSAAPMPWEPTPSPVAEPTLAPAAPPVAELGTTPPPTPVAPIADEPPPPLVPVQRERERPRMSEAEQEEIVDEAARIKRLRTGGIVTLGVGGGFVAVAGAVAGGYSTGTVGANGLRIAIGMCGAAVPPIVVGAAMLGAARVKQRRLSERLTSMRFAPMVARGEAGLAIAGRF